LPLWHRLPGFFHPTKSSTSSCLKHYY
jgi:hypothetical protein